MSDRLTVPAGWDFEPEQRPARSLLAGINPIALGTPMAESMAGYIARLSWQHGRPPVRLIRDVLAPALAHPSAAHRDAAAWEMELARVTRHPSASLLGHAPVAGTWADALGAAIGRPVLRGLTTLPWAEVLPRKNLLRVERAWCPVCIESRRLRDLPAYEPLLWQFSAVVACVEHAVRLVTACPSCGLSTGVLTSWARVAHCRCGTWLGSMALPKDQTLSGNDLDWQRYVTQEVGAVIARTPSLVEPVSGARTADAVRLCWARTGLSMTRLASAMGMALSTLSLWIDGRRQPSLPGVLRICRIAGVPVVDFLLGDLDAMSRLPLPVGALPYVRPSDERHRTHDWATIRDQIGAVLLAPRPRSLASILRELGLDTRQAKRVMPVECARIVERHARHMAKRGEVSRAADQALVRAAIAEIRRAGVYPSRHQVQLRLPSRVSLRNPDLSAIWQSTARESGRRFLKS